MAPQWNISPWWNNGDRAELEDDAPSVVPGRSPMRYPAIWDREREVHAYNPRFLPNTVTFDGQNRPVIRVGVHGTVGKHATVYPPHEWIKEAYIQTLNPAGQWIALSLSDVMKDSIADWNDDLILSGTFQAEERVVFDASGDAYTLVKTRRHGDFLLHSRDDMEHWAVYSLPVEATYRIERTASDRPPVIFVLANQAVSIIAPRRKADGTLNPLSAIDVVTANASDGPTHSGVGDQTVTVANKTHIVYISTTPVVGRKGTPQYVVTYDHDDQRVTSPVLLGVTGSVDTENPTDHHNGPAIVADSRGVLHVVLGAHQKPFQYTYSTRPNDTSEWAAPVEISNSSGKETYVSLAADKVDTLHLVSRMVDDEGYSLHYMRKRRTDGSWSDFGKLVVPTPKHYSLWNQKLTIDRQGGLFLIYFYYSHNLTDAELAAYRRKWPREEVTAEETNAHDPVILMSSDSGYNWRIATTPDMKTPWVLVTFNSPDLSDASGWNDVTNYSTLQTAVVRNELYLLARANGGIHTYKFNAASAAWPRLAANSPEWSDASGWNDVTNYSTIRAAVVQNELYLLGRANRGIHTYKFNAGNNTWARLAADSPDMSDASGWDDVTNYSTIQTAVVHDELYLLARGNKGIQTYKWSAGSNTWSRLVADSPEWSDASGWNDVTNYSTIQTAVVNNGLYLLARANRGIQTYKFNAGNNTWARLAFDSPDMADASGWNDVANYSTIQTAVVSNELYLLARSNAGIETYKFNAGTNAWSRLAAGTPEWSDASGWDDVTNYSTMRAVVVNNRLYLLARGNAGIQTYLFNPGNNSWSRLSLNSPGWSDASGWDDVPNYSTIQAAVVNNDLYLLARANNGIVTWRLNSQA